MKSSQNHKEICFLHAKNGNGNVISSVRLHKKIAEIKVLKQKLKVALNDRNKLLSNIREAFFSVDVTTGKTLFLSDANEDIYGYSLKEMYNNPNLWFEMIHPDDKEMIKEKMNLFLKGLTSYDEHRIIKKDGKIIWVEGKVTPTLDDSGRLIRLDGIVSDISKRKKEERLKDEKIKDLNTFIYKATHDLISPLSNLEGLIGLAKRENNNTYLALMETSTQRMKEMLNNLATIIETPHKKITPEVINFKNLLGEIKNDFQHLPEFEKINFSTEICQSNDYQSDKKLLSTILQNLINNSIKYRSFVQPYISINIERDTRGIKIIVQDNGIGIPEIFMEKIFEMFFRGTEVSKGTGLGLYIVKTTIQKLHGKITVESKEKKGTRFTIYLPDLQKYFLTHNLNNENET